MKRFTEFFRSLMTMGDEFKDPPPSWPRHMPTAPYDSMPPIAELKNMEVESIASARILRAFKPGDVVFIECSVYLSEDEMERLRCCLNDMLKDRDIEVVILGPGLKVVSRSESPEDQVL